MNNVRTNVTAAKTKNASPAHKDLNGTMSRKKTIASQYLTVQIAHAQIAHLTLCWMTKIISACIVQTTASHAPYKIVKFANRVIMSVKDNAFNAPQIALLAMMVPTVNIVLLVM